MSADATRLFASGTIESHQIATYVEVRRGGMLAAVPTVLGGKVDVNVANAVRRSCSIDIYADRALIPDTEGDLLYPGKCHLHVWRGIDWRDGRPGTAPGASSVADGLELWPLGVFFHAQTTIGNAGKGATLTIAGGDLSRRVSRNAWTSPWVVPAGSVGAAWAAIIRDRYPDAVIAVEGVDGTTPAKFLGDKPSADPWKDTADLATLVAAQQFVDVDGTFRLTPILDPTQAPIVAEYAASLDGQPTALVGNERRLDADKGYSIVVEDSNRSGGTPLRAIARDTNPASATYVDGDYGPVPLFLSSDAGDQATIDRQAGGELQRRTAAADAVSVDLVANPAHAEGDVIGVHDDATKVAGAYSLDSFSVPLDARTSMRAQITRVA